MTIIVQNGQNIFDIATIAYGDASLAYNISSENPGIIGSILSDITGLTLNYTPSNQIQKEAVITVTAPKKNATIQSTQTLFDLALQYLGSAESVYQLIVKNGFDNILFSNYVGKDLVYDLNTTLMPTYFRNENIDISTKDFYTQPVIIDSSKLFEDGVLFVFQDSIQYEFEV